MVAPVTLEEARTLPPTQEEIERDAEVRRGLLVLDRAIAAQRECRIEDLPWVIRERCERGRR